MNRSFIHRFAFALLLALATATSAFGADKLLNDGTRQRDMGDGTWAQVVSLPSPSAYRAQVTSTRPANTTTYSISDVVGATAATWTFPNMGAAGGNVMLTSADLRVDVASIPTGMTSFRLHLYNITPPSALADNAAWDLPSGDRAGYIGYIDLGSPADLGSTLFVQTDGLNKHAKLATGDTNLYGYLVTNGTYTPGAVSEAYTITLRGVGL